jgi:hypothetical protein
MMELYTLTTRRFSRTLGGLLCPPTMLFPPNHMLAAYGALWTALSSVLFINRTLYLSIWFRTSN